MIPYSVKPSREKPFADYSGPIIVLVWPSRMCNAPAYRMHTRNVRIAQISQNFVEKTFANGSKTAKTAKVFSLKGFPL